MDEDVAFEKIDQFWEWFETNDRRIREILQSGTEQEKESLVQTLNNQVLTLGMFTWEMGHGTSRPYYLTISPNGSRELLALSQEIMKAAPPLPDWELNPAKLAQVWDLKFTIYDEDYNEREVDASKWKFTLRQLAENRITILVEADNIAHLDAETKKMAVDQVVTSLLGEEQKILYVQKIEIFHTVERFSTPIQQLKQKFEDLID